ncbi:hypothetical protein Gotur_013578 [Gossypium turneri]
MPEGACDLAGRNINFKHSVVLSTLSSRTTFHFQPSLKVEFENLLLSLQTSLLLSISAIISVKENPEFQTLPCYLFGESLGGAVALKMHLKQPNAWSGACLVAPMCKIADDMVPPWILKQILIVVANILPKQKLVPQKDLAEAAFRDIKKRELTPYNVIAYKDKPRLRTALEMLRTTAEIEQNLEKVSLPILILHGENDIVTDPAVSKALYEKASSSDKNIIIYKDAGHSLLEGEPDDMINRVFSDIISWLDEHSSYTAG